MTVFRRSQKRQKIANHSGRKRIILLEEIITELSLLGAIERSEIDDKTNTEIHLPTQQDENPYLEHSSCLEIAEGSSYLVAGADPSEYAQADRNDLGNVFISFDTENDIHKLFTPVESQENCTVTLKVFLNSAREAIVQRDTDVLTKPEIQRNTALVKAAILE